MQKQTMKYEIE